MEKLKPMLFTTLKGYKKEQLLKDVIAGVVVAIIALPLSIALALASGVGPQEGIYTAIVAGFLISFFGGSNVQIAGPTAAFATIVAGIVASNGMSGLAMATVMAGVFLILMGIFRLGGLIKYIPYTITTGFTAGIAVTILIGQLKDFFGVTYAEGVKPIETIEKIEALIESIETVNWCAVLVGGVSLLILIVWPKISERIPGSLIAVIVGAVMVKAFNLEVNTIGTSFDVKGGLPQFNMPDFNFELMKKVLLDALTIAVLAAIESLLSCVVADGMTGTKHRSNMELVAQGIGNIGSALFGGIPATGAIARTAANIKSGGKTPIAGIVHAVVLLVVLLVLMPFAGLIPMPTIASILFVVAYNMCQWRPFVKLVKTAPVWDILVLVLTFVLTVVFDLVVAIAVGMVLSCLLFMKRMSDEATVSQWKKTEEKESGLLSVSEGIYVYELNGPLFFGASGYISQIAVNEKTLCLILRMKSVSIVDATALNALELLVEKCNKQGVKLILSHTNPSVFNSLKKSRLIDIIGEENIVPHINDAVILAEKYISNQGE